MTCTYCDRPRWRRDLCLRHYRRWQRHGDPQAGGPYRAPHGQRSVCSVEGCQDQVVALTYCDRHRSRFLRYGDPLSGGRMRARRFSQKYATCSVADCLTRVVALGLCGKHYQRQQRHGDPTVLLQVQRKDLTAEERFWSRVNRDGPVPEHAPDLGPCWPWPEDRLNSAGYGTLTVEGRSVLVHRYAYELEHGPIPDEDEDGNPLTVDHRCRVKPCCNVLHLEVVTLAENNRRAALARWGSL